MKHHLERLLCAVVLGLLGLGLANSPMMQSSVVNTHASRGEVMLVESATAELLRTEAGLTVNVFTRDLNPSHAYSAWWVVINAPENCENVPCSGSDVFGNTESIRVNVTNGGGAIADENGVANFFAHLSPGALPNSWWSSDFVDPYGVEVHFVLNDHGPVLEGMMEEMTLTYRGGCTDESLPAAFPDSAKADGVAGPNSCQLFQSAIFMP